MKQRKSLRPPLIESKPSDTLILSMMDSIEGREIQKDLELDKDIGRRESEEIRYVDESLCKKLRKAQANSFSFSKSNLVEQEIVHGIPIAARPNEQSMISFCLVNKSAEEEEKKSIKSERDDSHEVDRNPRIINESGSEELRLMNCNEEIKLLDSDYR